MLARPGAGSRLGEVAAIVGAVREFYPAADQIEPPGTLDGGDICEAGRHVFLGVSKRTNEEGARQLAAHLAKEGFSSSVVDVRQMTSILHLKSGISYIGSGTPGDDTLVVMEEMAPQFAAAGYDLLQVSEAESYAANCVRVNDRVLVGRGLSAHDRRADPARLRSAGPRYVGVPQDGWRIELPLSPVLRSVSLTTA